MANGFCSLLAHDLKVILNVDGLLVLRSRLSQFGFVHGRH